VAARLRGAVASLVAAAFLAAFAGIAVAQSAAQAAQGLGRIDRFVVIFLENRSFDNMFGLFPGANGLGRIDISASRS
jgi:phospholipase C